MHIKCTGGKMISARLNLTEYSNKVLNMIKIKFDLKDKSEALNKFMNMLIQSLQVAGFYVTSILKSGKRVTISSIFTYLRKLDNLSFIGDFPIISFIVSKISDRGISVNVREIVKAFRQSSELKEYSRTNNILVKNLVTKHLP